MLHINITDTDGGIPNQAYEPEEVVTEKQTDKTMNDEAG